MAYCGSKQILGFKKRFRYEDAEEVETIGERNEAGQRATERKIKLEQTASSNNNDDHGDKGVQNKRLKCEQEALRIQQNQTVELPSANDVLEVLHSEDTDSNSDFTEIPTEDLLDCVTFEFEDPVSNSNQSGEVETEYYIREGDECSQNKHLMGEQEGEEEALHANESEALIDFEGCFLTSIVNLNGFLEALNWNYLNTGHSDFSVFVFIF
ncbi:hypothetical protein OWV82_020256 [Melia azedarach]|uniref:Uncharacterized protein n=1 Tax=Melia azedarach TaxID=155640 RepID=A0ACC1X589_MELAZ|nr:hypothetical protein OWV82_020256 [Melia azedarach]